MIDMREWKTFALAMLILVGTFWLVYVGKLPSTDWWQGATVAGAMYTVRTVAAKIATKTNGGPNATQ